MAKGILRVDFDELTGVSREWRKPSDPLKLSGQSSKSSSQSSENNLSSARAGSDASVSVTAAAAEEKGAEVPKPPSVSAAAVDSARQRFLERKKARL